LNLNELNLPLFLCQTNRFHHKPTNKDFFYFFLSFVFLGVRVVCVWWWGGEPDMGKTFYLDSGCNNFIPNKPNSVSSMSLPWPCVNFRSWYHQEAINNGGNLSPTCKHYIWVIV